ncbi:MAG: SIR2 family protein [Anaerolineaceae bacterium]
MKEMLLLGAGASVDAEIPDSYEMTERIVKGISNDGYLLRDVTNLLNFVIGGLLFQKGLRKEDPFGGVNIEDLFTTVELLRDRQNSELSPFIGSWHPFLQDIQRGSVSGYASRNLLEEIYDPIESTFNELTRSLANQRITYNQTRINPHFTNRFERVFSEAVNQVVYGDGNKIFSRTKEAMVTKLCELTWISDSGKVTYLVPLIRHVVKNEGTIATLNYDNTIELACTLIDVEVDNGLESWSTTGEFEFRENKLPLIKLHGSIDWALSHGSTSKSRPLPYQVIKQEDPVEMMKNSMPPEIIFGGKNKLTAEGPFLDLLQAFEASLDKSDKLTIIGYSFRDEHINEFISKWFNTDENRIIRIISPNIEESQESYARTLLSNDRSEKVIPISQRANVAIAELFK